ncbi:MAG: ribose-phosphate pyrophosphokinase [Proteobacteria bacterium]|nr:ribose-phosphate pyrophosphokinase [Pseudomonadota bacterium]
MRQALEPRLFTLSESRELAKSIAASAELPLAALEERQFESGDFKLRPLESVRDRRTFIVESLAGDTQVRTTERLVRLLFLLAGLKDAGATERIALVPYLAFSRKERRTQLRDGVNTRYVAELLEAVGLDRLMTLDVHNPAALDNSYRVPVDHLSAMPMMADHFARQLTTAPLTVVSPDVGGIKRAQLFRELLQRRFDREIELAFIEKRRALDVVSSGALVGAVAGRQVIVIDDLCDSGGTLIRAASNCLRAGAEAVHATVTHAPLASGLKAVLAAGTLASVVTTDSVGPGPAAASASVTGTPLVVLPIGPLLGQAVRRVLDGKPLGPLLERWPVSTAD